MAMGSTLRDWIAGTAMGVWFSPQRTVGEQRLAAPRKSSEDPALAASAKDI
jgi:hypothetical protein